MNKIKLVDICNPKQWKTIPTGELIEEGYPVYGANGVIGYYSDYNHENPVVTITCRGATCGSINITVPKSYVTGNAMCLDDVRNDVEIEYLYYCLVHYDFKKVISGSAQPQITRQGLEKVILSICEHEEQIRIVNQLKRIELIIEKRKEELLRFDELIKARFVELTEHSDAVPTHMGDIATYVNGYAFKPSQWEGNGYPIIRIQNLNDPTALYNYYSGELPDRYLIHNGDVLVSWATHLEAYIWKGEEAWLNQHIFKVIFDKMEIDKTYYVYACEDALRQAFRNAHGFKPTMEHIKKADFDAAVVKLPDIMIQKEFAEFVKQVDKSKVIVQKSLDETKLLFDSLMQEYFG